MTVDYVTTNCINHPDKKAIQHSGHVHRRNGQKITSGWCEECSGPVYTGSAHKDTGIWVALREFTPNDPRKKVCRKDSTYYNGCDGVWKRKYGLKKVYLP